MLIVVLILYGGSSSERLSEEDFSKMIKELQLPNIVYIKAVLWAFITIPIIYYISYFVADTAIRIIMFVCLYFSYHVK